MFFPGVFSRDLQRRDPRSSSERSKSQAWDQNERFQGNWRPRDQPQGGRSDQRRSDRGDHQEGEEEPRLGQDPGQWKIQQKSLCLHAEDRRSQLCHIRVLLRDSKFGKFSFFLLLVLAVILSKSQSIWYSKSSFIPGWSCRKWACEGQRKRGPETDGGPEHQQVAVQPRERDHGPRPEELPRAVQELQADPPPPELSGGQQQDLDVCQHLTQGGAHQWDAQLLEICHQSQQLQHRHGYSQEKSKELEFNFTFAYLDWHLFELSFLWCIFMFGPLCV